MQVPGSFEYERATGVEDAIALLDRLGDEARLVAGGHSLLPMMKLRLANPEYLIDINDLEGELGYITTERSRLRIGAMTRHRRLLESDELAAAFPLFRDAEKVIADPVVRNRGTIGGSLCQADPAEDLTTICSLLDATCVVRGPGGRREIPMSEFLVGPYETALAHNEMLIEIVIPVHGHSSSAYAKIARRTGDWAIAAAGAAVTVEGGEIARAAVGLTAVNPGPSGLSDIADYLTGRPPSEEAFAQAGRLAAQACEPVGDARGTVDYKRHLASELTIRTLRTAVDRVLRSDVEHEPTGEEA
ncbi:xanthine dehydrogenase family protein subunit M [Rhodococcus oxybenzonivorans]|uniref:FAD binding domain-containing protein n=1 Tax=Rhodococcus oxybenzonivorans TaxID=1990687 RepID=UPI002953A598|nr:xanthine dehydrogenase family protein subunit M [Rhodococcus oxybenzonivorans]MDV7351532.1 xanthine dehydrogenase family protein subunit M [Rhodococcus oxybenzonivorans]